MFEKKRARNMARNHTQVKKEKNHRGKKKNAGTLTKPQTPSEHEHEREHEHDMHEHESENSHEACLSTEACTQRCETKTSEQA